MTLSLEDCLTALAAYRARLEKGRITDLFAGDQDRAKRMSRRLGNVLVDFSKQKIDEEGTALLLQLAAAAGIEERRAAMFSGDVINETEGRAVLHTALRRPADRPLFLSGKDVMKEVEEARQNMLAFAEKVREAGSSPFRHIVNLGIGGSDLGPHCVAEALKPYGAKHITCHFVANVDGADLNSALHALDPAETLFVVSSKTFTTVETMMNAHTARHWVARYLGESAVARHFCAVTTNVKAAKEFGIAEDHIFGFWDWVGGRYSLWSSIGLSLAILIGKTHFRSLLAGAHAMDEHFLNAPAADNIPLLLGALGVYHRAVCGYGSRAVVPYDQRLALLPAYLQQLDMESNGKSVKRDGTPAAGPTGPLIWGGVGTNSQHAFFQWLHQGSDIAPVEFLVAAEPTEAGIDHHDVLLANCLAQSEALMRGRDLASVEAMLAARDLDKRAIAASLAPHRVFPGDRPSLTILYKKLDPATLGALLALYEHRVFVEGVIYGINSFDQWGVELGKERATLLLPALKGEAALADTDPSTLALLAAVKEFRKGGK